MQGRCLVGGNARYQRKKSVVDSPAAIGATVNHLVRMRIVYPHAAIARTPAIAVVHIPTLALRLCAASEGEHRSAGRKEPASLDFFRGCAGVRSCQHAYGVIGIPHAAVLDRAARCARLGVDPSTQEPVGKIECHGHTSCVPAAILAAPHRLLSKTFYLTTASRAAKGLEYLLATLCCFGPTRVVLDIIPTASPYHIGLRRIL